MEEVEIPYLILINGAFPLRSFMLKPHGGALLPFGRLKIKFRVLFWLGLRCAL